MMTCLLVTGCSTIRQDVPSDDPVFHDRGVRITGLASHRISLSCLFAVENPHPQRLAVAGYRYAFACGDNGLLTGHVDDSVSIAAGQTHPFELPVTVDADVSSQTDDGVPFHLDIDLLLDWPHQGEVASIPFRLEGCLPHLRLPVMTVRGLRINTTSFPRAELECDIAIENPNALALILKDFEYRFVVNGRRWIHASVLINAELEGHAVGRITLPMSVDFTGQDSSAYQDLAEGGRIKYDLSGRMRAEGAHPALTQVDLHLAQQGALLL